MKQAFGIVVLTIFLTLFSFVLAGLLTHSIFNLSMQTPHWLLFALPVLPAIALYIRVLKRSKDPKTKALYEIQ